MCSRASWFSRWLMLLSAAILLLLPHAALAHERFIPHQVKWPVCESYFHDFFNPNMLKVGFIGFGMMAAMLCVWFLRDFLDDLVENKILRKLQGRARVIIHFIAAFLTDKPIEQQWFKTLGEWIVIMFMRVPALVLMFAAVNKSLVMTSYPLEPSNVKLFQFAQALMAVGMLTQTFLPLGGATIFGTFLYLLFAYDWKAAVDVLPVLTVAVIYVCAPWDSWKRNITTIPRNQMVWVRRILGVGFFILGWMKIYNYYLTVGVADNFPAVLADPMVNLFSFGTDPHFTRENWILSFSMAEILTGFLLMTGAFCRLWCFLMVYIFAKLMVMDFGFAEIPHLYPIGAFCVVLFSNNLSDDYYRIEAKEANLAKAGKTAMEFVVSLVSALAISALAIFPMMYLLTQVTHPGEANSPKPNFTQAQVQAHCDDIMNHDWQPPKEKSGAEKAGGEAGHEGHAM